MIAWMAGTQRGLVSVGRCMMLGLAVFALGAAGVAPAGAAVVSEPFFSSVGVGGMTAARAGAVAAPLPGGDVLIAGGESGSAYLATAELYDPSTGTFTSTGNMTTARVEAAAAPLPGGDVLIAGGGSGSAYLATAELYDPSTGTFTATGNMGTERDQAVAAPLPDGDVLVAGGYNAAGGVLQTAELYDPATGTFSSTGEMATAREGAVAAPLPDGDVLVAGGFNVSGPLSSAEIYDPATGSFGATGDMTAALELASAAPLPDGDVLIAGGFSPIGGFLLSTEFYDPATGTFTATSADMTTAREAASAAPLPDGDVLIAGGLNSGITTLSSAELFHPAAEARIDGGGFGWVTVGQRSAAGTVSVRNLGAQALSVSGVALIGADATDFSVVADGCAGAVLAFGQSCDVTLSFSPLAAGARSAMLALVDNEATPASVTLSGTGVPVAFGPTGSSGVVGATGAAGATGAPGAAGAAGAAGASGELKLILCERRASGHLSCTSKLFASPLKLPAGVVRAHEARASLVSRVGLVLASGRVRAGAVRLMTARRLRAGRYALSLRYREGSRWRLLRRVVRVR